MNSSKTILLLLLAFLAGRAQTTTNPAKAFSFIAFGDMPYTLPQDYARFEKVIAAINQENSVFTVDVGDIKSSSTPCSEESYNKILAYFQQFDKPLIYIPGDNEWTDCGKKDAGAYDPEERLGVLRKLFFKDPANSFGKQKMALNSQSRDSAYANYVENKRWEYNDIMFATVHVVGTNNNFVPVSKNGNREFYQREKADLAWLEETFAQAGKKHSEGVVIVLHADMFLGTKDLREASGFNRFKDKLKSLTVNFKKPVLLVNGDSHVLLIDKPFYEDKTKKALTNFTRLQVPGEENMHAVKITIQPGSVALFQFEELIVPGN